MQPYDLYKKLCKTKYTTTGFDLDYAIELDHQEKKIRLMFQASRTKKDWIINILSFIPYYSYPVFFSYGWKKVFNQCKALIFEEIIRDSNLYKDYKIEICGHSYGGAMSVIVGIEYYNLTGIKPDVITFGAPKPLIFLFSKIYGKCCLNAATQYAHKNDLVTLLPPLPEFYNINIKRIGKFTFTGLLDPKKYHTIYGNSDLYDE